MPANDGTARIWISVMTPGASGPTIEHMALDYNFTLAAAKMRAQKLPEDYALALETGLWPSLDILPIEEQQITGIMRAA